MHPAVQTVINIVSAWESVSTHTHRFGGVEFKLDKVEIGHVHGHGLVDIPFTRKLRELLVEAGQAQPHHLLADSGWISFYLRSQADAEHAVRLLRLSYVHKRSHRNPSLDVTAELAQLAFSDTITAAVSRRQSGSKA